MLAAGVVEQIQHLLGEGVLSQRKIAQRLGVSRGSVTAVASGRRRPHVANPIAEGFVFPSGLPRRCPGCGGMVQMPCLLCRLRARQRP
jgi:hypothetical protein